jgi:V/A-type H+-transporting ATPase subunit A
LDDWFAEHLGQEFIEFRQKITRLLHEEDKLMETVKLIGEDILPDDQKLIIAMAKVIRVGFLQQNAFHSQDTFVPLEKQKRMMEVILKLYDKAKQIISTGTPISEVLELPIFAKILKMKYDVPNDKLHMFDDYV